VITINGDKSVSYSKTNSGAGGRKGSGSGGAVTGIFTPFSSRETWFESIENS
jgi:hypothetical protein